MIGVLIDTNFARVSCAPARLHCYIRESTIWTVKASPHTRLPVFCPIVMYIFTADPSKTLSSAMIVEKQKKCVLGVDILLSPHLLSW